MDLIRIPAQHAFNLIVLLIFLLAVYRIVRDENPVEFWHFISSHAADGKVYGDLDKAGQIIGLVFSTWVVCFLAYTGGMKETTGVVVFVAWLIYASGMGAFSKWARAFISSRYGKADKAKRAKT